MDDFDLISDQSQQAFRNSIDKITEMFISLHHAQIYRK